jgi:Spy/CpxP family protein refolding chaperone
LFSNSIFGLDRATTVRYIADDRAPGEQRKAGAHPNKKRRIAMCRKYFLAVGIVIVSTLTTFAQQPAAGISDPGKDGQDQRVTQIEVPPVEQQMKVLTEKLDLTKDQQARIAPIIQTLHDISEKIAQDKSLSFQEQLAQVRPHRYEANKQLREILSDDQKAKLDQYLAGPHSEIHGNLSGKPSSPSQSPQN